jgi:hypothetical protein
VREPYIGSRCPWSIAAAPGVTFICDAERVTRYVLKWYCLMMLIQTTHLATKITNVTV